MSSVSEYGSIWFGGTTPGIWRISFLPDLWAMLEFTNAPDPGSPTWFAGSSVLSHPDYLRYFNELAGDHPERILIDSDLDWGQDIKRLSKRLKEVGAQEVYLDTLLVADFEKEHGIPHEITQLDVARPPTGWVAIGFTYWKQNRLGLFDRYPQLTLWPDVTPPLERVGKSMLLWYFPPGPRN